MKPIIVNGIEASIIQCSDGPMVWLISDQRISRSRADSVIRYLIDEGLLHSWRIKVMLACPDKAL